MEIDALTTPVANFPRKFPLPTSNYCTVFDTLRLILLEFYLINNMIICMANKPWNIIILVLN